MIRRDPISRTVAFIAEGAVFACIVGALCAWSCVAFWRERGRR